MLCERRPVEATALSLQWRRNCSLGPSTWERIFEPRQGRVVRVAGVLACFDRDRCREGSQGHGAVRRDVLAESRKGWKVERPRRFRVSQSPSNSQFRITRGGQRAFHELMRKTLSVGFLWRRCSKVGGGWWRGPRDRRWDSRSRIGAALGRLRCPRDRVEPRSRVHRREVG